MLVNHFQELSKNQITNIITDSVETLKNGYEIDYINLLKDVIRKHFIYTLALWFLGCSVIGIPLVYLLIVYKGFSLAYTLASIGIVFGLGKGILFSIISLFFQNLLIIPAILALAVSSMNLYTSIMKNRKIENVKLEIIRHTIFSFIMLGVLVIASLIETYISSFLLNLCVDFF